MGSKPLRVKHVTQLTSSKHRYEKSLKEALISTTENPNCELLLSYYASEVSMNKKIKSLFEVIFAHDENEIFVPDYQREFVWPNDRRSKFIESVLIGLPIPYIFVADVGKGEGRLEIVDGSQRIRTLAAFVGNEFELGLGFKNDGGPRAGLAEAHVNPLAIGRR